MVAEGSKRHESSRAPPRKINVQKFSESRGPELAALHSIVSTRLNNNFRSKRTDRRRTTSHDNQASRKRHRKRRRDQSAAVSETGAEKLPRRVRRRLELKGNPESGFVSSRDGTKRLRTHVWHAKRFSMAKLWGFFLPSGLHGRGRGSRAVLKWLRNGAVVHDASYFVAVQLEGSEDSINSILEMVLEPSPSTQSEVTSNSIRSGALFGTAMLHHVGGRASQAIAPVTYMWRPSCPMSEDIGCNGLNPDACDKSDCRSSTCQLWVWIHAAAFSEGYDALKFACQKQTNDSGALIDCISLEGKLGRLEVMGSKAFQLIQNILQPVACNTKRSWDLRVCSAMEGDREFKLSSVLEEEGNMPLHLVLSQTVKDPRMLPKAGDIPGSASVGVPPNELKNKEASFCSKPKETSALCDNRNLWDVGHVSPPVEESVLCLEKHNSRLNSFFINDPKSRTAQVLMEEQGSRSCPILLLKNKSQMCPLLGWSVVLPLSWVKVFWMPLISKGAHAIGLREKRWISCEVGLPYFPSDFPDCVAYSSYTATVAEALDQKAKKAPPAVRSFRIPIPPPWNTIRDSFDKASTEVSNPQISSNVAVGDDSNFRDLDLTSRGGSACLFQGIVARTSFVLADFLKKMNGSCLPIFPKVPNTGIGTLEPTKCESMLSDNQASFERLASDRNLCFLRVILHAYKEGSFEEGAIVCAPILSDISLWTSRSDNNEEGLQLPQSSVRTCFTELSPGHWKLQVPSDPEITKFHRWPIGFVTTGFTRGSKKPAAEALCEAVLLARLREEQWGETPLEKKKETYVLVRNLRSSAYRLAIVSLVLEEQEHDVEFL